MFDWLKRILAPPEPKPDRILVDREGVAYLPTRPVQMKGRPKGD